MSSSSFWSQIRWRLGGSEAVMNRINDLIQKQIMANSEAQDVTVEEILNPIVTIPSKMVLRDHLFQVKLRSFTTGQNTLYPIDPDLEKLRLWINNEHGGRYLTDHSFMNNKIQLNGTDQTKLVFANDDNGINGSPIVNRLIDDQYMRVEDNANVRIKEIAATEEGFSCFIRLFIERAKNQALFGKPNVLFSKIDTEQVDYAYAGYLVDDGGIVFIVRIAGIEYFIRAPSSSIIWTNINLPDYSDSDYTSADYNTLSSIAPIPDPAPYVDLGFTFDFSDKRMQIIRSEAVDGPGIVVADSNTVVSGTGNTKHDTNLKGFWRMLEGGPIGVSPGNTIYDSSPNALNGVAIIPVWLDTDNNLQFTGNNAYVVVATDTGGKEINDFTTAFTFAAWAKITAVQDGYAGLVDNINGRADGNKILIRNNGADTEILWRGHNGTDPVDTLATKNAVNVVGDGLWHHYLVTYDGTDVSIYFDGTLVFAEAQTYTLGSGTTAMTLGWGSTSAGSYHLTGWMQDATLWNTNLTAQEVTDLYNQSRPLSYFPKWLEDPPTEPPPPGPVTNPFVSVYNVPLPPLVADRDTVRLHAISASSLTEEYNVGQGTQQSGSDVTEDGSFYSNDPPYNPGGTGEVVSDYNQIPSTIASWLRLDSTQFGGEKIQSGNTLIGKVIKRVTACMVDYNPNVAQATGNIVAKIKKAAGGTDIVSSVVDAADLANNQGGTDGTFFAVHDFEFLTNTYQLVANDKIQFEYDQGGTGGGGGETATSYTLLGASIAGYQGAAATQAIGQHIRSGSTLLGKIVTKVVIRLADISTNGSTGPIQMFITNSSQGTTYASSNTIQATELANDPNDTGTITSTHTFTFASNTHALAVNDIIILKYNYTGSGSMIIGVAYTTSGGTDGANTELQYYIAGSGWFSAAGRDACMDIYEEGTVGSQSTNVYNNPPVPGGDTVANLQLTGSIAYECRELIKSTSAPQYNKIIKQISVYLGRSSSAGSSTGSAAIVVGVGRPDGAFIQFGQLSPSTPPVVSNPDQTQLFNFTFNSNTHIMRVNDYVTVAITGSGWAAGSIIHVRANGGDPVPGCNVLLAPGGQDFTVHDVTGQYVGETAGGTGGGAMQVAIGRSTSSVESLALQYDGQWANPTSTLDRTTQDLYMQVYVELTGAANHLYHKLNDDSGQNRFAAIYINSTSAALVGKKVTRITARLRKQNSPTGTIFCRIKKGAGGSDITFGLNGLAGAGLSVATLTTPNNPADPYNFENYDNGQEGGYALVQGDRIIFEYSSTSSDATTNYVEIARTHSVSTIAGVNMQLSTLGTTWTDPNSSVDDVIGTVYVGGFTIPNINPYHTLGFGNSRVSQKVTSTQVTAGNIHNKKITQVKPWLARIGSPTGLINVVIRDSADVIKASINTMQAGDVSNVDYTQYTFTNLNNTYPLALNDRISIEFSGGDTNNHIRINTNLLNTYPFGVLETYTGSGPYTTKTNHDLAGMMSSGGGATDPLARTRVGEQVVTTASALKLKKISRVKVWMKRTADPTGNVTFLIRGGSNDAVKATIGTKPIIDVDPNDFTEYTITSSPIATYALQVGDYVTVEYNAGDDFRFVEVMTTKTTDGYDGILTALSKHNGNNWVSSNAIDLVGQMFEGGDTFTPSQEDVLIPDPAYTKDLTVLAGGPPWSYINHATSTLTHAPSQFYVNAVMPDFRFYRKVLTVSELTNIFTNRLDRGDIPFGQVALIGYFALTET